MLRRAALVCGLAILILYTYGLDRMGVYSADEPRYASIGRAMARTGDIVTPHLWGDPWFEKPALLYWMIAAGYRLGLPDDLAPRLPVALLSVAFLAAFFWILRREFSNITAAYATAILATAAGWLAISEVAVTDLPMSAFFGLALLCTLPWLRTGDRRWLYVAAAALGTAFLAKSGPPIVLALPILWFGRHRWRDLLHPVPILIFLAIAAPWYIACYARNGPIFLRTLFLQHQLERFVSPSLQHVQPWWFYIPILPLGLFPWTPVLAVIFRRSLYHDLRLRLLLAVVVFGFVFFSASLNKLPFYLLPLMPPLAVLMGVALERSTPIFGRGMLILSAALCCLFPFLVKYLPWLMSRDRQAAAPAVSLILLAIIFLGMLAIAFTRRRPVAVAGVAALAALGYFWIKVQTVPFIDVAATARPLAPQVRDLGDICAKYLPRDIHYGLNYYLDRSIPYCPGDAHGRTIVAYRDHRPLIVRP